MSNNFLFEGMKPLAEPPWACLARVLVLTRLLKAFNVTVRPFFLLKVAFDTNWENTYVLIVLNGGLDETCVDNFLVFAERAVTCVTNLERANQLVHKFGYLKI